jgi:hypothetical protein
VTAAHTPTDHRLACQELLQWLASQGKARRSQVQSFDVIATYDAMAVPYPQISDAELPALLNATRPSTDLEGWIYGPETGKAASSSTPEIVPAITASWSWTGSTPSIQIIVALLMAGSTAQTGLEVTAFRFENADDGSSHDFWHAQPTVRKAHRGEYLEGIHLPLHESVPAFPIDAVGPVGAVVCVLLSLYGSRWIENMFVQNPRLRNLVSPYLSELPVFASRIAANTELAEVSNKAEREPAPAVPRPRAVSSSARSGRRRRRR